MELTKIYFFFLTVLTNFSLEIFAQDTLSGYTSSTTDKSSESGTLEPSTATPSSLTAAAAAPSPTHRAYLATTTSVPIYSDEPDYANITIYDKSLLRTTESTWDPVPPSLRFGLPTNMRRGRPKCCRRVRENEKGQARKMKCRNGSIFSRDARGRRRRKCRRRNRCKKRCKQHYTNTAWSIVGTVMKGLDFFIPKLEFKFHTGTLVFGTKFFSGLVPFIQAKMQAMQFFYSLFEPLLDGVLDVLDFGRIGFRSMSLDDEDDDDDADAKKPEQVAATGAGGAVIVDEKNDAEQLEDYDDADIVPDLLLAKNDDQTLPAEEDEVEEYSEDDYDSPKEDEPVDEDYGIDEDWDSEEEEEDDDELEDDDAEDGEEDEDQVAENQITRPRPNKLVKRPHVSAARPTRKSTNPVTRPSVKSHSVPGKNNVIQELMNRIKDNITQYHSNIVGPNKPVAHNRLPYNDTQILNVDNLVLNINSKPAEELYEDDVEYQDEPADDLNDDKLIDDQPQKQPVKRVKSKPPPFSSFGAFFGAISDAFDAYFSGTY